MHLLHKTIGLTVLTLILTACGGGSSDATTSSTSTTSELTNSTSTLTPSSLNVAVDNTGHSVQKSFNGYEIKVLSDKNLIGNDELSHSTIAVYGTINDTPTNALLKINSHYRDSNLTVEVYKNAELLATKKELSLTNQIAIDFGQIDIK